MNRKPQRPQGMQARVISVAGELGKRYAVTVLHDQNKHQTQRAEETITFSLRVWGDREEPRRNQIVRLYGVRKFSRGWRATGAEPVSLER